MWASAVRVGPHTDRQVRNVKVCDGFQKQLAYGTAVNDSWRGRRARYSCARPRSDSALCLSGD